MVFLKGMIPIRHSRMLQLGIQVCLLSFGPLIKTFRGDGSKSIPPNEWGNE